MRAKAFRGREVLRDIRLRRLARDVRDMARRLRALELRQAAELAEPFGPGFDKLSLSAFESYTLPDDLPEAGVVPTRLAEKAKPRITSGATGEVRPVRAPVPKGARIAWPPVSGMERMFTPKQGAPLAKAAAGDDKVFCGPCGHRVPTWFGADCITVGCPLKGAA